MRKLWFMGFLLVLMGCQVRAASEGTAPGMVSTPYQRVAYPMGTVVNLRVYNEGKDAVLDLALERISELEALLNVNENSRTVESEVELINANAGLKPVPVSEDTFYLVEQAVGFSQESEGIFNASIGALTGLWRIGFEDARRPADEEIAATLPLLDFHRITLDEEARTVFLEEAGMRFDLGAIAKGFIADEVVEVLAANGVTSAIIDLGGNIFVMGENYKGKPWRVGVQNPFSGRGESVVTFLASNQSIVTSGIYERYLEHEGEVYHHILNSATGFPFDNEVAGVTIVSDLSIDGDKYTTLAFGLGIEAGLEAIEEIDGLEAIYISRNREIFVTSGLSGKLQLENEEFTLMD